VVMVSWLSSEDTGMDWKWMEHEQSFSRIHRLIPTMFSNVFSMSCDYTMHSMMHARPAKSMTTIPYNPN
jgi:hypothetical protein